MIAGLACEHPDLPVPAAQRARHQRLARCNTGRIDPQPGLEIVGPVQHDVEGCDPRRRILNGDPLGEGFDRDMRIEAEQPFRRRLDLRLADLRRRKGDLPLKVGQAHHVVVDQAQRPDTCRSQIERRRRPHAARADDQHARALQRLLPRPADFGQDQMARIAFDFVFGKDHRPI